MTTAKDENDGPLSREEAMATVCAPGTPYETTEATIYGVSQRVFKHAPVSLRALYESAAQIFGDREFIIYENDRSTYAQTIAHMASVAQALQQRGVQKGDRVAIAMRNYPEFAIAFGAITSMGAVAVGLNSWWQAHELHYGLKDSGARFAFVDQERMERVRSLSDVLPLGMAVARPAVETLPENAIAMSQLMAVPAAGLPQVDIAPDDDAIIMYTSGSTAHPKGVVSSHRAILSSLLSWETSLLARRLSDHEALPRQVILQWLAAGLEGLQRPLSSLLPQRCALLNLPLFHVTGLHAIFLISFRTGRKLVMMYKWDPEVALQLIERERITDMHGVPTMSWELIHSPNFSKYDTSSLETIGAGGAARPAEQVRQLKQKAQKVAPGIGYGLTETNALGAAISGADYEARPTSVGRALEPLLKIEIRDEQGNPLPPNTEGEICIKSPTNMRGYWNKPEATAEVLHEGWLHTGDIGKLDDEGFLYITDRAKDVVIRGGENISCNEVESALYEHPAVFEASVHGLPDERLGEVLCATIHLHPGKTATEEELQKHVGERLAKFKIPTHILFIDSKLPRIASDKVDKRQLKQRAAELLLEAKP